jgi:ATP-dependent Clp protease protease subunit
MIHQPLGGARGQCSDIQIQVNEIMDLKKKLNNIYVKHSDQTYEAIEKATDRDNYLSSEQAREFGLIDSIIENKKK